MICFIVEGDSDKERVKAVYPDEHYIVLNGVKFQEKEIDEINQALTFCQHVCIFTDPDKAGDNVEKRIRMVFPGLPRIKMDPEKAKCKKRKGYKYGVEYCSNQYIKKVVEETLTVEKK